MKVYHSTSTESFYSKVFPTIHDLPYGKVAKGDWHADPEKETKDLTQVDRAKVEAYFSDFDRFPEGCIIHADIEPLNTPRANGDQMHLNNRATLDDAARYTTRYMKAIREARPDAKLTLWRTERDFSLSTNQFGEVPFFIMDGREFHMRSAMRYCDIISIASYPRSPEHFDTDMERLRKAYHAMKLYHGDKPMNLFYMRAGEPWEYMMRRFKFAKKLGFDSLTIWTRAADQPDDIDSPEEFKRWSDWNWSTIVGAMTV